MIYGLSVFKLQPREKPITAGKTNVSGWTTSQFLDRPMMIGYISTLNLYELSYLKLVYFFEHINSVWHHQIITLRVLACCHLSSHSSLWSRNHAGAVLSIVILLILDKKSAKVIMDPSDLDTSVIIHKVKPINSKGKWHGGQYCSAAIMPFNLLSF